MCKTSTKNSGRNNIKCCGTLGEEESNYVLDLTPFCIKLLGMKTNLAVQSMTSGTLCICFFICAFVYSQWNLNTNSGPSFTSGAHFIQ